MTKWMKSMTNLKEKNEGFIIGDITVLFVLSMLVWIIRSLIQNHALYLIAPDSETYISIVFNFIYTGRFIQSKAPEIIAWILPPGFPVLILLAIFLFGKSYLTFMVLFQYILYSGIVVALYYMAYSLTKQRSGAILASLVFLFFDIPPASQPYYILTETYYVFLIVFAAAIICSQKPPMHKASAATICSIAAFFIRPACAMFLAISFIALIVVSIREKKKKPPLIIGGIFAMLFLVCMLSNYMCTGHFFFGLEGYSGATIYRGNNPDTKVSEFASSLSGDFSDDYYDEVMNNGNLDYYEKSELLSAKAKEYILSHPVQCMKNAIYKCYYMFVRPYGAMSLISVIMIIYYVIKCKKLRAELILITVAMGIFIIVTSFGLNIARYGYLAVPFYCMLTATALSKSVAWLYTKLKSPFSSKSEL